LPVKMRLRRMGAKHQPSYRIVVADSRSPRDGRYIDQVGFYNPVTNPAKITLDQAKAVKWLRQGAQPTETVEILLKKFNIEVDAVRKGHDPAPVVEAEQVPSAPVATTAMEPTPVASAAPVVEQAAPIDAVPTTDEGPSEPDALPEDAI
jgi:small subunit ribosomal protein S16